jgi:hypothetical protein
VDKGVIRSPLNSGFIFVERNDLFFLNDLLKKKEDVYIR